jgi:hypothetical protein
MNIQFAVKDGEVYLIEVNPRASRTVPFVAKAIGQPVAKIAARVMAGEKLSRTFPPFKRDLPYMAVKEAVFPFARFPGIDPVLSPEMKSTGEVMGIDRDFATAFAKSQLGAGTKVPQGGTAVRLGQGQRQGRWSACGARSRRSRLPHCRYRRHAEVPCRCGPAGRARQQGRGRAPAHRRPDHRRRNRADLQHDRGLAEPEGLAVDPLIGAQRQGSVFHHGGGEQGGCAGNSGKRAAQSLKFARCKIIIADLICPPTSRTDRLLALARGQRRF